MELLKSTILCVVVYALLFTSRIAFCQPVVYFRNDLKRGDIDLKLSSPQNPNGTTRHIANGKSVAYRLFSAGPFEFSAQTDDGTIYTRQGVELQTIATGIADNGVVSIRGVFDDSLDYDENGVRVVEKRVAVTFTFPLRNDRSSFMITAMPDQDSVSDWRCRSMNPQNSSSENAAPAPPDTR